MISHANGHSTDSASKQPAPHNLLLTLSYVLLFVFWGASAFVAIPVSLNLIVTSSLIIYIGSHRSLRLLVNEEEGGMPAAQKEIISAQDAYKFPFIGSAALFSLYLAFKYLDKVMTACMDVCMISVLLMFMLWCSRKKSISCWLYISPWRACSH
jgi:hypothetical protein